MANAFQNHWYDIMTKRLKMNLAAWKKRLFISPPNYNLIFPQVYGLGKACRLSKPVII